MVETEPPASLAYPSTTTQRKIKCSYRLLLHVSYKFTEAAANISRRDISQLPIALSVALTGFPILWHLGQRDISPAIVEGIDIEITKLRVFSYE